MKRCEVCGETKPLDEMKKDKRYPDGRAKRCKKCHNRPTTLESKKRFSIVEKESWPSGYRICVTCKQMLQYEAFNKNKNKWNGIEDMCKECRKPVSKAFYDKWLRDSPEMRMFLSAKYRAKSAGIPFTISVSDIVIPEYCPVLGIKIVVGGDDKNSSPSLDKFIPELGYVPGNIHVISFRANWLKQNATLDEIEKLAHWMKEINVLV